MGDDEFVLEASETVPVDMDAVLQPVKDSEDTMAIDEEGRPRFAPSRDIVRAFRNSFHSSTSILTFQPNRIP